MVELESILNLKTCLRYIHMYKTSMAWVVLHVHMYFGSQKKLTEEDYRIIRLISLFQKNNKDLCTLYPSAPVSERKLTPPTGKKRVSTRTRVEVQRLLHGEPERRSEDYTLPRVTLPGALQSSR